MARPTASRACHDEQVASSAPTSPELVADCSRCFGLCCVLLPFRAVDGFGADKPGGQPCHHLEADDLCGIHEHLEKSGWPGCTAYDCQGAGQQVSQVTYAGVSWREQDNLPEMAAVLSVMRVLHGLLARLEGSTELALHERIVALTSGSPEELLTLDLEDLEERVAAVSDSGARPSSTGSGAADGAPEAG